MLVHKDPDVVVCAWCNKILEWKVSVEIRHLDEQDRPDGTKHITSHGMCPACAEKMLQSLPKK